MLAHAKSKPRVSKTQADVSFWGFLSILLVFAVPSRATETGVRIPCHKILAKLEIASWNTSGFTSPSAFDPAKFRLIVHKISPFDGIHWEKKMIGVATPIDLLKEPQRIAEAKAFSASVISEKKSTTYNGFVGLILEIPEKNIVATRPVDMQTMGPLGRAAKISDGALKREMEKYTDFYGVITPEEILTQTPVHDFNEILVTGESDAGNRVKVIGFAVFDVQGMKMLDPTVEKLIADSAKANGIPVIRIDWSGEMDFSGRLTQEPQTEQFNRFSAELDAIEKSGTSPTFTTPLNP
jgi:hypothetical protein